MAVRPAKKNGFVLFSDRDGAAKMLSFSKVNDQADEWFCAVLAKKDALPAVSSFSVHAGQLLVISTLKGELLRANDREKMLRALAQFLPQVGIKSAAVFVREKAQSAFVGGFFGSRNIDLSPLPLFGHRLFPEQLGAYFRKGVYFVCPFALGDDGFGYVIFGSADIDFAVYRDVAKAIGDVLQNVRLFDTLTVAKNAAERAVREKTEFFANRGADFCDLLTDLSVKITQMEANVAKGILDADILDEQLLFLKSQVVAQLEKTETVIELLRAQAEDVPMDKNLFSVASVLPPEIAPSAAGLPLLFGDTKRIEKAVRIFWEKSGNAVSVSAEADGIHLSFDSAHFDWQHPLLLLAEKNILLQYGFVQKSNFSAQIVLPYPNLAGLPPLAPGMAAKKIYALAPTEKQSLLSLPIEPFPTAVVQAMQDDEAVMLYWDSDGMSVDMGVKLYAFRHDERLSRVPVLCYDESLAGQTFITALRQKVSMQKKGTVLFIDARRTRYGSWATDENALSVLSLADFEAVLEEVMPALIVFESVDVAGIKRVRSNPRTVLVPILVIPYNTVSEAEVDFLCDLPRVILCNRGAVESELFGARMLEILGGDEPLPSHTGALIKKAILYLNKNFSQQIVRWKLADTVHVSEDYLTRIFHKELGLSLWEYLNRYRIYLAERLLLETNDTVYEIAERIGFQDKAYFCRVFKKIYGISPGKIRAKQSV